ncbi:MAG TPA: hypothetical protein VFH15_15590, partial [Pyrinomonadaceae bacterium]|nr:hypothetical protein [Pyrinomonadaceae bacterium]
MAVTLKSTFAILALVACLCNSASSQTKKPKQTKPVNELARLQEEFINATKDYKTHLDKLLATYERDVTRAEAKLTQTRDLFEWGLIAKAQVNQDESALA